MILNLNTLARKQHRTSHSRSAVSILSLTASCSLAALLSDPVLAQQQTTAPAAAPPLEEIIVSARKREESLLRVPIIETVIPGIQLERMQAIELTDLAKMAPGLNFGQSLLSIGTLVAIRGVGTSSQDPGIDQSVSLNIDGLALGQGLAFASGMFDIGQVEVLKGPQALFFGKSSPGGVIAINTADPGSEFELIARAGYEFEAEEELIDLIVSGPLTDTLGARLSARYSRAEGYFENTAITIPGTGALDPFDRDLPGAEEDIIRGTLLWTPSDQFEARLKATFVSNFATDAETQQRKTCPEGTESTVGIPFLQGDDCELNKAVPSAYLDPAAYPFIPNDGQPFLEIEQRYGTLELNYQPTDNLTLTSLTGLYDLESESMVNTGKAIAVGPPLGITNDFSRRDISQEVRLNSDFASPWNFTVGAFYQDGKLEDRVSIYGNTALGLPVIINDGENTLDIEASSVFGQLRWQMTPELELAGGIRWTDEERSQTPISFITNAPIPVATSEIRAVGAVPEFTVTYTPTDDLTVFGAYKEARKSGSFTVATLPTPGANNSFDDEEVEGWELGLKTRLLEHRLTMNLAGFYYEYAGLQVGATTPSESGQPIIRTVNAGSAESYGIEFDVAFVPAAVERLQLRGAVLWNHARYEELDNVSCWAGQTIARGCSNILNPVTGLFTAQDLSGTQMYRAPEWTINFGFDYELPIGNNLDLVFSGNTYYSAEYPAALAVNYVDDGHWQDDFIKSDLSLALRDRNEAWEVAVIGKNLEDEVTCGNVSITNFQNGLIFGGVVTGGEEIGPAGFGEAGCFSDTGRSIWLRLTVKPAAWMN